MKTFQLLSVLLVLLTGGCDDHSHSLHNGGGGHHVHTAPHGGELYELGPHGSGFNFELLLINRTNSLPCREFCEN